MSGSCLWHEKNDDRDTTYTSYHNYDDIFDTEYTGFVNLIDRNCCGVDSIPSELNQSHEINTFEPSASPSPTFLQTITTTSIKVKEDLFEVSTIISGSSEETGNDGVSFILVAASGTFLFGLMSYFWKTKKRMLFSRNRDEDCELVDPSQFEHVVPQEVESQEKFEDIDPSAFDHVVTQDLENPEHFEEIDPSMFEHIVP